MCGVAGIFGPDAHPELLEAMVGAQVHRGPDSRGLFWSPTGAAGLGHTRLRILDLTDNARQPMADPSGRYWIAYNGEVYNFTELRHELEPHHEFRSRADTEVVLAAYLRWGEACLPRFWGMFAFAIWDEQEQQLFAARDRFGVKPLHYSLRPGGGLWLASEIKALLAAGLPPEPDVVSWATYLAHGHYDHGARTFFRGVRRLGPGASMRWTPGGGLALATWYDPATAVLAAGVDPRAPAEVAEELRALLQDSVRLRFRSQVPVGLCLSGGLDSSLLLALAPERRAGLDVFTFACGDEAYDETPWADRVLQGTPHRGHACPLIPGEVPRLAVEMMQAQDEPYGGLPTLGMGRVHERAREHGVVVLLDGNGLDEAWAGYDYYARAQRLDPSLSPLQGSRAPATRPQVLNPELAGHVEPLMTPTPFGEPLRDLQYRDLSRLKIPRALRFADRAAMHSSRELREPFLDHRIVELGLRQSQELKIRQGVGKWLVRELAQELLPAAVVQAPKRPVQTPQREWLRGPLKAWVLDHINEASLRKRGWLRPGLARAALDAFFQGAGDNSFFVWQWLSIELWFAHCATFRSSPNSRPP